MKHLSIRFLVGFLIIGTCACCFHDPLQAEQIRLVFKSGSTITIDAKGKDFEWTTVDSKGQLKKRLIRLSNVVSLELVELPSSKQVAKIRQLLNELASSDYHVREAAENSLMDDKLGGPYIALIKQFKGSGPLEVRHRIARIIKHLESESEEEAKPADFDQIVLNSGETLNGDAGDWSISGTYRDQGLTVGRESLRRVEKPNNKVKPPAGGNNDQSVVTKLVYQPENEFFLPEQTTIDFETDSNGFELKNRTDVTNSYLAKGLKPDMEGEGFIGISGFPFRYPEYPIPKENSVCVFDTSGRYDTRFKGVATFSFCVPGQPNVPGGVHEFALYAGRIDHSRDLIMEAYNGDGHLIGTVEATDTRVVFLGIKSNELITRLRVLSNPYLYRLERSTDTDFAMDHVCFSTPQPVFNDGQQERNVVKLRNGDVLVANKVNSQTTGQFKLSIDSISDDLKINLDEVLSLNFAKLPKPDQQNKKDDDDSDETKTKVNVDDQMLAILPDRSLIRVKPGKAFSSSMFDGLSFQPTDLLGLTSTTEPVRYPGAEDFGKGKNVLVFPTCRIATSNLVFNAVGYSWKSTDEKILQLVNIQVVDPTDEEQVEEPEDPTPQHVAVDYGKTSAADTPTIWFAPPGFRGSSTGLLKMTDGQQIVLGGSAGFDVIGNSENGLIVASGDARADIPWNEIQSIEFPAKKTD